MPALAEILAVMKMRGSQNRLPVDLSRYEVQPAGVPHNIESDVLPITCALCAYTRVRVTDSRSKVTLLMVWAVHRYADFLLHRASSIIRQRVVRTSSCGACWIG